MIYQQLQIATKEIVEVSYYLNIYLVDLDTTLNLDQKLPNINTTQ